MPYVILFKLIGRTVWISYANNNNNNNCYYWRKVNITPKTEVIRMEEHVIRSKIIEFLVMDINLSKCYQLTVNCITFIVNWSNARSGSISSSILSSVGLWFSDAKFHGLENRKRNIRRMAFLTCLSEIGERRYFKNINNHQKIFLKMRINLSRITAHLR